MLFAPYSVTKLFEFQEGYITSAMVSVDMCEILHVLWEQDNKVVLCNVYRIAIVASTLQLSSACLGSNHLTATDSLVWDPMLMDLEYPDKNSKSQLVPFCYVHRLLLQWRREAIYSLMLLEY